MSASITNLEPILVDAVQAATLLSISERALHTLASKGRIQSVKLGGSRRFSLNELRRLANEGASL